MRFSTKIISLAVVCFLTFVVAIFPARAGLALLVPVGIEAFGVTGTIWQGQAKLINASGQQLRNTEWDLSFARLLIGQIGGNFSTRASSGFVEGFGTISLGGTIRVQDARAGMDAGMLQALGAAPALNGQISIRLDELELSDNWPVLLVGEGQVINLSSPLMGRGEAAQIGNARINFDTTTETTEGTVTGKISDDGGPLQIDGTLLLTKPANYSLKVRLKARPGAPKALQQNLEFLGSPESDGTRIFQLAGSL
jgi:general secretion pathway protein N